MKEYSFLANSRQAEEENVDSRGISAIEQLSSYLKLSNGGT